MIICNSALLEIWRSYLVPNGGLSWLCSPSNVLCVPGDDERTVLFLLHCFLCGPNYSASECVMCTFWPDKWVQHSGPVAFLLTLLHTFLFYLECYLFVCFHTCDWGWNMGWKIQNSATYVLKKSSNARNISRLSQVVRELNIQIAGVFPGIF